MFDTVYRTPCSEKLGRYLAISPPAVGAGVAHDPPGLGPAGVVATSEQPDPSADSPRPGKQGGFADYVLRGRVAASLPSIYRAPRGMGRWRHWGRAAQTDRRRGVLALYFKAICRSIGSPDPTARL